MKRSEVAQEKFRTGYNCSQSVFYSFCDDLGFDKNTALKLACGFGAGMGRKEEVCGAVTGGILVLGLKYGRGENQDIALMDHTYLKTRELMDRFREKYSSFICRELLEGCELTTPEGQQEFKARGFREKVCVPCVGTVVEILEDILTAESSTR